jgi:hypothetical protein
MISFDDRDPDPLFGAQNRSSYHGWECCIFSSEKEKYPAYCENSLTTLWKGGAGIANLDELYERNGLCKLTLII